MMNLHHYLGQNFLAKTRFNPDSGDAGMDLRGAFFYRSQAAEQQLQKELYRSPLATLENISQFIDGAFTLVFIDNDKQELWAVTDPYGLNKLYCRHQAGAIQLTDDLDDFTNKSKLSFSVPGLHEYLRFLDISPPATCFEGIRILEGGAVLKIAQEDKGIELFGCNNSKPFASGISFEAAVEKAHVILSDGLRKRLEVSGKVGLFLSGGVDSSLLASLLAEMGYQNSPDKMTAYTVGFDDSQLDESSIAQSVANHLGISHKVLKFDLEEEYRAFFEICGLLDVPFADPAVVPTYLSLQHMRTDRVEGVMEGTGADGLIGANLPTFYHRILKIDTFVPVVIRKMIANLLEKSGDSLGYLPYFNFESAAEKFIRWKGWTRPEIEKLSGQPCSFDHTAFYKAFREHRKAGAYELYRKLLINMPDYRITDTCRLMSFNPVFPFFDQEFRDFMESLPTSYKYRQGENKALFKEMLARMVPRAIWDVPKHGFDYPFDKLLLYKNADLIYRYLSDEALDWHGFFNKELTRKYRDNFLDGDNTLKFKIWTLVFFQGWYERYYTKSFGS